MRERSPTLLSQQPCLGGHQDWNCSAHIAMSQYAGVAGRICVPCSPVLFRHRADLAGGEPMLTHPWSATGSCGYDLLKLMQWLGAVPDGGATTAGVEPQAPFVRGCLPTGCRLCQNLPTLAGTIAASNRGRSEGLCYEPPTHSQLPNRTLHRSTLCVDNSFLKMRTIRHMQA